MTLTIKRRLHIDDSLDVFPVHGVGGILGTLMVGVFCSPDLGVFSGLGFGGDNGSISEQLQVQVIGVVATFVYTAALSWILLKVVGALIGLRVTGDQENEGLDIVLHDERGYDIK